MAENIEKTPFENESLEKRLWDYIDGLSNPDERSTIEELIASSNEWNMKYKELLEVNELLHSSDLNSPSMRFTKNVMEEIGKLHIAPATKTYINNRIIWGLGIFFITMVLSFVVYGFGQVDWTTSDGKKLPLDLTSIDFSKMFNSTIMNVFMMINVILGLILFDRYLSNKRKSFKKVN
jgi:hypothetical protein